MKRAIIVHGWDGKPRNDWYPWLKKELENRNYEVIVPTMPNTSEPKIDEWVSKLKDIAKVVDEETLFIGHSVGCQAILRYLETLNPKIRVKKCIFVAPWMNLDKQTIEDEGPEVVEIARPWMETPINWKKAREHCKEFTTIFSDDDPYVPLSDSGIFKKELDAKVIILKGQGHFTKEEGITKLPEILQFIR